MNDIGHLEFGALQRPLGFGDGSFEPYTPADPNYWLAYWIAAFEHVAERTASIHIVSQDSLRETPHAVVTSLLNRLNVPFEDTQDFSTYFRNAPDPQPTELFDPKLLSKATEIYDRLEKDAVR